MGEKPTEVIRPCVAKPVPKTQMDRIDVHTFLILISLLGQCWGRILPWKVFQLL